MDALEKKYVDRLAEFINFIVEIKVNFLTAFVQMMQILVESSLDEYELLTQGNTFNIQKIHLMLAKSLELEKVIHIKKSALLITTTEEKIIELLLLSEIEKMTIDFNLYHLEKEKIAKFKILLGNLADKVVHNVCKKIKNKETAEEIVQEIQKEVDSNLEKVDSDLSKIAQERFNKRFVSKVQGSTNKEEKKILISELGVEDDKLSNKEEQKPLYVEKKKDNFPKETEQVIQCDSDEKVLLCQASNAVLYRRGGKGIVDARVKVPSLDDLSTKNVKVEQEEKNVSNIETNMKMVSIDKGNNKPEIHKHNRRTLNLMFGIIGCAMLLLTIPIIIINNPILYAGLLIILILEIVLYKKLSKENTEVKSLMPSQKIDSIITSPKNDCISKSGEVLSV